MILLGVVVGDDLVDQIGVRGVHLVLIPAEGKAEDDVDIVVAGGVALELAVKLAPPAQIDLVIVGPRFYFGSVAGFRLLGLRRAIAASAAFRSSSSSSSASMFTWVSGMPAKPGPCQARKLWTARAI